MAEVLDAAQVADALDALDGWELDDDGAIVRTVEAEDFLSGIDLVVQVARAAEEAGHHPDIDVRYTDVTFRLITHDADGLTDKDVALASTIDDLVP